MPLLSFCQDISLFRQYNGRYSYSAIGNTLNPAENNLVLFCETLAKSSATLNLNDDQNIVSAYIYWAGSGNGDKEVTLNETELIADETLLVNYEDPLQGPLTYFSCLKEITSLIKTTGNGEYTLKDLDIEEVLLTNPGYCNNRTNFAGWAIFIVYEQESLPLNQVSIYHGLEIINRNQQEINITIENLNVLDNGGAKIGFLAWEGDNSLNYGESLIFNNNVLKRLPLNPGDNAFNGTNTFTNSVNSFNMDLDVYNIENFINIGDDSAAITLTTGEEVFGVLRADLIIINNIVTVLNSQLPDATVVIDKIKKACDNKRLLIDYSVFNLNSTEILPSNTPISFYAKDILVGGAFTENDILIGDSESNIIEIVLPNSIPTSFEFKIVVDDLGDGTGIVQETNEFNNETKTQITQLSSPSIIELPNIKECDLGFNTAIFDLTKNESIIDLSENSIAYYLSELEAINKENEIASPSNYKNTADITTIYVRIDNDFCYTITSFDLIVINCPPLIPTGFSPNNDGVNDGFNIQGLLNIFDKFELKIYNRYGTLIYQGGNELGFWDGKPNKGINHNGGVLPVGTYYYVLHLNDDNFDKPLTGWVYLNY